MGSFSFLEVVVNVGMVGAKFFFLSGGGGGGGEWDTYTCHKAYHWKSFELSFH